MSRSSTVAFALLALVAGASAQANVWEGLKANPVFSTSVLAYERAGLTDNLKNPALTATLFVPTNAAWDIYLMASKQTFDTLPLARVADIMRYTVFNNVVFNTTQLINGQLLTSVSGRVVTILKSGELITVDAESYSNSPLSSPLNVKICKSIVHGISWPIIPNSQVAALAPPPSPPVVPQITTGPATSVPQAMSRLPDVSIALSILRQYVTLWNTTDVQNGNLISTWFLPTDTAMLNFFAGKNYNATTIGKARAEALMLNHVVAGDARPTSLWKSGDKFFTQLAGKFVTVQFGLSGVINVAATTTAKIVNANNVAGKALFHICDNVLVAAGAGL